MRRCRCILCRADSNQGSNFNSDFEVRSQQRTSSSEEPRRRIVRSIVRGEVQLHTTPRAPLRRVVGTHRQAGEVPTFASHRRNDDNIGRSRGGAQQPSNSTAGSRPGGRRGADFSPPNNRRGSAFAAARIRRRRDLQRTQVMEALASTLRSQADILAGLVSRLHPGASNQSQIAHRDVEDQNRSGANNRRLPATTLVDRDSRRRHRRRSRQGQSGGGRNQRRSI